MTLVHETLRGIDKIKGAAWLVYFSILEHQLAHKGQEIVTHKICYQRFLTICYHMCHVNKSTLQLRSTFPVFSTKSVSKNLATVPVWTTTNQMTVVLTPKSKTSHALRHSPLTECWLINPILFLKDVSLRFKPRSKPMHHLCDHQQATQTSATILNEERMEAANLSLQSLNFFSAFLIPGIPHFSLVVFKYLPLCPKHRREETKEDKDNTSVLNVQ